MNKIWFKEIKPYTIGGYRRSYIPVSKEGWIVTIICVLATIAAFSFAIINEFSKVLILIITLPIIINLIIAKIKS